MTFKTRFGSQGQRSATAVRSRFVLFGGATLFAVLIIVATVVLPPSGQVDAREGNFRIEQNMTDNALGTVRLLVPISPVPKATRLAEAEFRLRSWPRTDVPEGAVRDFDTIRDMFARVDLPANSPVIRSNLSPTPVIPGVQELIPPGHRAVTIEVDATEGVEGYATPGAHVDVLLTFQDTTDNRIVTRVAVEDAVVLSFNRDTRTAHTATNEPGKRISARSTVTLAVAQEDALKIQTARSMGRLTLVLRSIADTVRSPIYEVDSTIFQQNEKPKVARKYKDHAVARFKGEDGLYRDYRLGTDGKWYLLDAEG